MISDELGNRMKTYYEEISKTKLTRRTPIIIRIDGKAFHTFTRSMDKPFDKILIKTMQYTTQYLCKHIQGCKLGYTQSDEISLLITDYDTLDTSAWFDYEVQKIVSISASMATMAFNFYFKKFVDEFVNEPTKTNKTTELLLSYTKHFTSTEPNLAMFDSRCFSIPKEEVTNYFYWRQLDAMRNSVNMVGQHYFNQKEMNKKSVVEVKEMLKHNAYAWESYPIYEQRGTCVYKKDAIWIIDEEMPVLKGESRNYIDKWLQLV